MYAWRVCKIAMAGFLFAKPHLFFSGGEWFCIDEDSCREGIGLTMESAYRRWK